MRKPRTAKTKPTAAETNDQIIGNLANAIVDLRANCDETRSALNSAMDTIALLGSKIEILNAAPATTTKEPTAFDVSALVGVWIDEQQSEGKTTVDLARVNDIRTGIELGLSLSAGG